MYPILSILTGMKVAVSMQVLQATMPAIMSHFLEYLSVKWVTNRLTATSLI